VFQTFEVTSSPETGPTRLAALREKIAEQGLDGFIVPRADRFQGEYVAPSDDRLAWLTGFTGSAGFACVFADDAGVFIDGRYRVQVRTQVADVFSPVPWPETQLPSWTKQVNAKGRLGFDPWLHTVSQIAALEKGLSGSAVSLAPCDNLVDAAWSDRPAPPANPFIAYPDELAGETSASKCQRLAHSLKENGQGCALITSPDSVAWLLNIRGTDIERNPVPHAMALLNDDATVVLFCNPAQVADLDLSSDISVKSEDSLLSTISASQRPILLDGDRAPFAVKMELKEDDYVLGQDPCVLPKACKTDAEISGSRDAHLRDGAAMVRFLAWLDTHAPKGGLTEIDVVTALEGFRRDTNALRDVSFETICGAGPNGAIVHYRVNENTNRPIKQGELLLVDSGGQRALQEVILML